MLHFLDILFRSINCRIGNRSIGGLSPRNSLIHPRHVQTDSPHSICNHALRALLFVVLYVGGAELGHQLSFPECFATFWPPSGIFLAALLRTSTRQWPTVVLLALISNLVSNVGLHNCSFTQGVGFWLVNSIEAVVGAWLLRRLLALSINWDSLGEALAVMLVGGVLNTLVGATLGALFITQAFAGATYTAVWHLWWISDMLGVIVFAPILLTLTSPGRRWLSGHSWPCIAEAVLAFACLITTSQMVYGPEQHPLAYLAFPVLIWIALRFDIRLICLANVARAVIAIWKTEQGYGPFATSGTLADQVLQLQAFLCLTSVSLVVLAVVVLERRRAAQILQDSEARYRELLEGMDDLVHRVNSDGTILYANRAWLETLGYSQDELQSLSIFTVIDPADHSLYRQNLQRLLQGESLGQFEMRYITRNGKTLIVEGNCNCRSIAGQPPTTRSIFRDITDRRQHESQLESYRQRLEEANRQLTSLATTDALTGLQNRRAFQERLTQEVQRAQRYDHVVSLLLLDVDFFKQFNDSFGHLVGDEVLIRVSRLLEDCVRTTDYVARFGGEEFAIILPNTDGSGALILAERIRETIALTPFPNRGITVSLGVATLGPGLAKSGDMADSLALVKSADDALYFAKLQGRNQVRMACELQHVGA